MNRCFTLLLRVWWCVLGLFTVVVPVRIFGFPQRHVVVSSSSLRRAPILSTHQATRHPIKVNKAWSMIQCQNKAKTMSRSLDSTLALFLSSSSSNKDGASSYQVSIEYCTGCRWGLRSFWMAQELLTTFVDDNALTCVTIVPSQTSGRFVVKCHSSEDDTELLWDRKEQGGFPEMKELKQLVRDQIDPNKYLGHSDTADRQDAKDGATTTTSTSHDSSSNAWLDNEPVACPTLWTLPVSSQTNVVISYCTGCKWLFRAVWFAQELLLSTFDDKLSSLTLVPNRPPSKGGSFTIRIMDDTNQGTILWDRSEQGGFPQITQLKQLVRDIVDPSRDLGHSDIGGSGEDEDSGSDPPPVDDMDDDEAAEARSFFGVL